MRGIVADANIEGHVERLVNRILGSGWTEFWDHLGVTLEVFDSIGLTAETPDDVVWRTCQREQLILITANRNGDGARSLEATIRAEGLLDSLPVLTLSDAERVLSSGDYAERVVAGLIEYLVDIEQYRGAGRLDLP